MNFRVMCERELHASGSGDFSLRDPEAIPFLFPSRYCRSDRLRQQAQDLFGHLKTTHAIASAVSDWIFEHVSYVGGSSGETCSVIETFEQR